MDARTLDLAALRLLVPGNARLGHGAFLRQPRLLDLLARHDFRLLDGLGALDLALADFAL